MLKHVPVKLGMIIACAVLRCKRQKRTCNQRVFLHGMHETPTSAFPAHTLDKVLGGKPSILATMMVMQKTLIDLHDLVSLSRGKVTIFSDGIEIIMPLLANFGFLSQ